jgi:hypothetical protein
MILFKKTRERIKLLEYENEILRFEIKEIKKQLKPITPIIRFPRIIREDGWDLSYDTLLKKYRK